MGVDRTVICERVAAPVEALVGDEEDPAIEAVSVESVAAGGVTHQIRGANGVETKGAIDGVRVSSGPDGEGLGGGALVEEVKDLAMVRVEWREGWRRAASATTPESGQDETGGCAGYEGDGDGGFAHWDLRRCVSGCGEQAGGGWSTRV